MLHLGYEGPNVLGLESLVESAQKCGRVDDVEFIGTACVLAGMSVR
jgi:hypothetical protein